jgi:hypothetical protein
MFMCSTPQPLASTTAGQVRIDESRLEFLGSTEDLQGLPDLWPPVIGDTIRRDTIPGQPRYTVVVPDDKHQAWGHDDVGHSQVRIHGVKVS